MFSQAANLRGLKVPNQKAAGSSASLNKTITEIMGFLKDAGPRPNVGLRPFLHEKIGDLAEHWYSRGFSRGHIQSRKAFLADGKVPRVLEYSCTRNVSPKQSRDIKLRSIYPKKKSSKRVKVTPTKASATLAKLYSLAITCRMLLLARLHTWLQPDDARFRIRLDFLGRLRTSSDTPIE